MDAATGKLGVVRPSQLRNAELPMYFAAGKTGAVRVSQSWNALMSMIVAAEKSTVERRPHPLKASALTFVTLGKLAPVRAVQQ